MTRSTDVTAHDRVPYRMLEAVPELGGGDRDPANMLIQGDNSHAHDRAKALSLSIATRGCQLDIFKLPVVQNVFQSVELLCARLG